VAERKAAPKNGQTVSAEEHKALQSEVAALRSQLGQAQSDADRARREANVQGVKTTQGVPAKLVEVMPGDTIVAPDGTVHTGGDQFVFPWGPAADELETLGHIRIVDHDASGHDEHDDAVHRWEVKANEA